jgi:EF-P beta-lysylation protein EpmB
LPANRGTKKPAADILYDPTPLDLPATLLLIHMIDAPIPAWQLELGQAVRDPAELLQMLGLAPDPAICDLPPPGGFALRVPRAYVARMRPGDPHDPLLRQVLPLALEQAAASGYAADPVADRAAMRSPGLLHKYRGRVLLLVTGACAVHCRYCFRRHFPYAQARLRGEGLRAALDYIAADPSVHEVILSGGDPLTLPDATLAGLVAELARIPHLRRLRLHTRLPVVLPSRVDSALVQWLQRLPMARIVVIHANHARELDADATRALQRLAAAGAVLLNQSVLLRGVNDDVDALAELSQRLFDAGVMPYYLHQLDRVLGAAHFEVDDGTARRLLADLQARLPGYLVPRLVREEPGLPNKNAL